MSAIFPAGPLPGHFEKRRAAREVSTVMVAGDGEQIGRLVNGVGQLMTTTRSAH
jgi:hypothetical protein